MTRKFDWRTPANTEDFETFLSRSPFPPVDIKARIVAGVEGDVARITVQDYEGPPERARNVSYRVYFIPSATLSATQLSAPDVLKSVVKLGSIVGEVKAPGNSASADIIDTLNGDTHGWYVATGINRKGEESEATPPLASPNN